MAITIEMQEPTPGNLMVEHAADRLKGIRIAVRAAYTNAVEGDIAEFGTGQGMSFQMIAMTMNALSYMSDKYSTSQKRLLGFDSFKGFPKATLDVDKNAPMVRSGVWGEGAGGTIKAAELLARMSRFLDPSRIQLFEGFYVDTLKNIPAHTRFSMVHLDCDLYESTVQVLDHLFTHNHLSDGCQLLFDDFLENRMSKKMGQRRAWAETVQKHTVDFTDLGFYCQTGWRCVVHTA